jgi:iron complex outermembrane receptor protein
VTQRVNVFGGVRYSRDHKDYDLSTANSTSFLRSTGPYSVTASESWGKVTYRAGLDFKPSDAILVYSVVSTGFKSGGFQDTPSTAASAVIPFSPETATNYEAGVKTTLFGRKLIFNPSIFWTDYENLQVRSTVGTNTFTTNAGSARIKGFELTMEARPIEGLSIAASYAYTDARFRKLIDRGVDYSGNGLTRNPKHKVAVSPSYRFPLASGASLTAAVDYQYESKIFDGISNDPNETRPAKSLVDARLVLDTHQLWQLSIWGKNLTNEIYRTHQFYLFGGQFAIYGPLRTYGATVTWRF